MQIKCPCCGEAFKATIVVADRPSTVGPRRNAKLAELLDEKLVEAIKAQPSKFKMSGVSGIWENRRKLPEELQVLGRDTMHKAIRRLLTAKKLLKELDGSLYVGS